MEAQRPYPNALYEQFCDDIEENTDFEVQHYQGRFFYEGAAVFVEADELQDVIRATTTRVQTDDYGKTGVVVYPR